MRERGKFFTNLFEAIGRESVQEKMECKRCGGKGTVQKRTDKYLTLSNCPVCKGKGFLEGVEEGSSPFHGDLQQEEDEIRDFFLSQKGRVPVNMMSAFIRNKGAQGRYTKALNNLRAEKFIRTKGMEYIWPEMMLTVDPSFKF